VGVWDGSGVGVLDGGMGVAVAVAGTTSTTWVAVSVGSTGEVPGAQPTTRIAIIVNSNPRYKGMDVGFIAS
jgi:hypothetical protein